MKKIFLFILPISFLLSARIAVIGHTPKDSFLTNEIKETMEKYGHRVRHEPDHRKLIYYDLIISNNYHPYLKKHCKKTILVLNEPPIIIPAHKNLNLLKDFLAVYTWDHGLCKIKGFEKYYFPRWNAIPETSDGMFPFAEKKLVCMINSILAISDPNELYSERKKIADYYVRNHPKDLDIYGMRKWPQKYRALYKGCCPNKFETLRKYRFCYCYENWRSNTNYISEKIYDALNCLCVPIYLGSNKITDMVPKEAFIDARNFKNIDHIHHYISNMDEETYLGYINAIIKYRTSPQREKATYTAFNQQICEKILELLD